jgi:hypothetical protein
MATDSMSGVRSVVGSTLIFERRGSRNKTVEPEAGSLSSQVRRDLTLAERYAASAERGFRRGPGPHDRRARQLLAEARAIRRQARALRLGAR